MTPKILTVDDSRTIRMILGKAFHPYDVHLCEAANGEEGLAVAAREKPNLILLDVTMPVMDGVTMLVKLKADPKLKSIPVIMLTSESGHDNVVQIIKLGASDYLVKPFKEPNLLEKVGLCVTLEKKPAA
jgi:two-component system, cell cycle response regulator